MSAPGKSILGRVAGVATGRVVELVDPDVVLEYVDLDLLIDRIDIQRIVDRIDPNLLMDRIDVQRLISRVDLNEVLAGVDLDLLLARVDLEKVVQRSGVPDIIMASTGRFADSALDLGRRQVVGVDALVDRGIDRVMRRPPHEAVAPEHLRDDAPSPGPRTSVTGHYAGPLSRALAAAVDIAVVTGAFAVGYFVTDLLTTTFFGHPLSGDRSQPLAVAALAAWAFLYIFIGLAVAGRSLGKAVVGLRVVRADGLPISVRQALVRTLVLPLSAAFAGIGLLMILFQREHRALHDLVAGTAVVTDWGDRSAELSAPLAAFLARAEGGAAGTPQSSPPETPAPR